MPQNRPSLKKLTIYLGKQGKHRYIRRYIGNEEEKKTTRQCDAFYIKCQTNGMKKKNFRRKKGTVSAAKEAFLFLRENKS